MPEELIINNEHILDSKTIASKLTEYFSSIAQILNRKNTGTNQSNLTKLIEYVNNKVSDSSCFNIPCITTEEVFSVKNSLDTSKATGLDGIGPKIIKGPLTVVMGITVYRCHLKSIKCFHLHI